MAPRKTKSSKMANKKASKKAQKSTHCSPSRQTPRGRATTDRTSPKRVGRQSSQDGSQFSADNSSQGGVPLNEEPINVNQQPAVSKARPNLKAESFGYGQLFPSTKPNDQAPAHSAREPSPANSDQVTVHSPSRLSLTKLLPDDNNTQALPQPSLLSRRSHKKDTSAVQTAVNPSFKPSQILKRSVNLDNLDQAVQQEEFPVTHYNSIRASRSRLINRASDDQHPTTRTANTPAQDPHYFNLPAHQLGQLAQTNFNQVAQTPLHLVTRGFYNTGAQPQQHLPYNFSQAVLPQQNPVYYFAQAAHPQQQFFHDSHPSAQSQLHLVTREFYNTGAQPQQRSLSLQNFYQTGPQQQHFSHPNPYHTIQQHVTHENFNPEAETQPRLVTREYYNAGAYPQQLPAIHPNFIQAAPPQQPCHHNHSAASYYQADSYPQRHDSAHSYYQPANLQQTPDPHSHEQFQYTYDSDSNISSPQRIDTPPNYAITAFPPEFLRHFVHQPNLVSLLPPPRSFATRHAQVYCKDFGGYFSQEDIDYIKHKLFMMSQQDQQPTRMQLLMRARQAEQAQQRQVVLSPTAAPFNPPAPTSRRASSARSSCSADTMNKYAWVQKKIAHERVAQSGYPLQFSDVSTKTKRAQLAHSRSLPAADPALASAPGAPGTVIPMRKTILLGPDMDISDDTWQAFMLALASRLDTLSQDAREYEERVARTPQELSAAARNKFSQAALVTGGRRGLFEFTDEEVFGAFGYKAPSVEQVSRLFACYQKVLAEHQKEQETLVEQEGVASPPPPPPPMQGEGLGFGVEVPPVAGGAGEHFLADTYLARGGPKLQRDHISLAIRAAGPFGKGIAPEDEATVAPAAAAADAATAAAAATPPPTKKPLGKAPAPALVPASLLPDGGSVVAMAKKKVPAATLASPCPSPWALPSADERREPSKPSGWPAFNTSVWNGKQLPAELRRNQPPPASANSQGEEGPFKSFIPGLGPDHA